MDFNLSPPRFRIELLDLIRGATLISMIFYHLCYNLYYLFGRDAWIPWYPSAIGGIWQETICLSFLLLAGVCTHFMRHTWRRLALLAGSALLITLVTWLITPGELIVFGILHCMTLCTLVFLIARPLLRRIPPSAGLLLTFVCFLTTVSVPRGTFGIGPLSILLPRSWYVSYWLSIFGLLSPDFYSADYFPIFPYLFIFLCGYFLYSYIIMLPESILHLRCRPLNWLGRHSLLVYLLHQPILFGVMQLLFS